MLAFNVKSIVEERRRLAFANTMLLKCFDVICLTKTWLVSENKDKELHPGENKLFGLDRLTTHYKKEHSGVLNGLEENTFFEKLTLKISAVAKAVKLSCDAEGVIHCCVDNLPDIRIILTDNHMNRL